MWFWRLASLALIAAACTSAPAGTTTSTVTASTVPTTTGVETTWVWGIDEVDLGDGYALAPCEGDADQIACVLKDESVIGSAEHLRLLVESFDNLDGVDDPVESIELIAIDYVATFLADRRTTCPHLEFRELAPTRSRSAAGLASDMDSKNATAPWWSKRTSNTGFARKSPSICSTSRPSPRGPA